MLERTQCIGCKHHDTHVIDPDPIEPCWQVTTADGLDDDDFDRLAQGNDPNGPGLLPYVVYTQTDAYGRAWHMAFPQPGETSEAVEAAMDANDRIATYARCYGVWVQADHDLPYDTDAVREAADGGNDVFDMPNESIAIFRFEDEAARAIAGTYTDNDRDDYAHDNGEVDQ